MRDEYVRTAAASHFRYWHLRAVLVHADERDIRREHARLLAGFDMAAENLDMVGDGRAPDAQPVRLKTQHGLQVNALVEGHLAHADRDEVATRVVAAHGHPRDLIHPHQHLPAEEEAVVVQVTRHYEFVGSHGACAHTIRPGMRGAPARSGAERAAQDMVSQSQGDAFFNDSAGTV